MSKLPFKFVCPNLVPVENDDATYRATGRKPPGGGYLFKQSMPGTQTSTQESQNSAQEAATSLFVSPLC